MYSAFTWRTSQKWIYPNRPLTTTSIGHISKNDSLRRSTMATPPTRTIRNSPITVTFLGTASAIPSRTRAQSSLTLRVGGDLWLFDCGESTQSQFQKSPLHMQSVEKIFITHMHGDHVSGLIPLICSLLDGMGGAADGTEDPRLTGPVPSKPPLEIYGPLGTRAYIRSCLKYTYTALQSSYVVHELRFRKDPPGDFTFLPLHKREIRGRNIEQDDRGFWRDFYQDEILSISASPIRHSIPCVGYVVQESTVPGKIDPKLYVPHIKEAGDSMQLMKSIQEGQKVTLSNGKILQGPARRAGRKLVILGDTYNPQQITPLAMDTDVLIHEATNAFLPALMPKTTSADDTFASVEKKAKSHGHSTPQMAGAFAQQIRAKTLLLNHFSTKYPGNINDDETAVAIMNGIKELAKKGYDGDVVCASDLMSFDLQIPK